MAQMWGGRFEGGLDPFFAEFNRSLMFDVELAKQDLAVNIAWARALGRAEVLTADEVERIEDAIVELDAEWAEEGVELDPEVEDIHSLVEIALTEKVGDLARKLHTGRSRNDQVATDLKLYLVGQLSDLVSATQDLTAALVDLAERHADTPIPGYTHLQRAQPITVGHHALAYAEMLERDRWRLSETIERSSTCPLGAAALAGTAFPIDRDTLADELGFAGGPARNSLDAVSDRDHVCDALYASSMLMIHLSRMAEDYIFFASYEARFVQFSDAVATGSSLMPQKKNPDAMELVRGKTGRVAGALQAMMMTLKGLPLAYDKDLQEDKEGLFDALNTTLACVVVTTTAIESATFDAGRCRAACAEGYLNATDLADLCVREGMAFRDAHEAVGLAVRRALELGVELDALDAAELRELFPDLDPDAIREALTVDSVLARRDAFGGTAPRRVREAVAFWRDEIADWDEEERLMESYIEDGDAEPGAASEDE